MAAPVDSARQGTNIATAATSHAVNVGSPVAGTLLIVFVRFAAAPGTVTFTGYTELRRGLSDASDDHTYVYCRQADGSEGATDTLSTTNSVKLAAICWEITGAANPTTRKPELGGWVLGTTANANPGQMTPGSLDLLGLGAAPAAAQIVNGNGGTSEQTALKFTPVGNQITEVTALVAKAGAPTDNLVVEIQTDSAGLPSGTVVAAVATHAGSSLTTALVATTWSGLSIGVTAGTSYWLVFRRSGSYDDVNGYRVSSSFGHLADLVKATRTSGTWSTLSPLSDLAVRVLTATSAADYLFLTVIGLDSETATATQPAGYSNLVSANSGTGGAVATNCMIWGASKSTTSSTSDDPAAWTSSAPATGVTAWTIAIAPAAPVGPVTVERSAALNAAGAIATVGRETLLRTSLLNAVGAVASAAIFWTTLERAAAANAAAAIQTAGEVAAGPEEVERAATANATAAIATSGRSVISRSAAVNASAMIVSVGTEGLARAAALTATGAIGSSGVKVAQRQAELAAAAAVSSTGEVTGAPQIITGQASLAAAGTIAVAGTVTSPQVVTATAHLEAVATIEVTISGGSPPPALVAGRIPQPQPRVVEAAAHLHATAHIEVDNRWIPRPLSPAIFTSTATLTATGTLGASGRVSPTAGAGLAATAIVTSTGYRSRLPAITTTIATRIGQASLHSSGHMRTNWDTPLSERQRDEELLLLIGGDL